MNDVVVAENRPTLSLKEISTAKNVMKISKKERGSVSGMAEYREGSILARIQELENENTELLRQIRQRPMEVGEVVILVAVIDHNLTKIRLLEELKAMVEARRGELRVLPLSYYKEQGIDYPVCYEIAGELTRLLGDGKEVE